MKLKLHWQILIALLLSIPFGLFFGVEMVNLFGLEIHPLSEFKIFAIKIVPIEIFSFIGKLFLNALKMLIVPLIVSAIITGIANVGGQSGLARLGGRTLLFYMTTSFFAIVVGLAVVNLMQPGIVNGEPAKDLIGLSPLDTTIENKVGGKSVSDVWGVFLRMVPTNIIAAAANGQMLGLITFSLLFGYFITRLAGNLQTVQMDFWNGIYEAMMKLTHFVMYFAPIGVFGLVAKTVGTTGFDALVPLLKFAGSVLLALAVHMFIVLPLMLLLIARVNPTRHWKAMAPAILTAFSTSSSSATLPETLTCVQERSKVSKKVSSFVLPLGATVNMDGTALYECVAAMFIAQAYGLEITFTTQFTIVLVALLTSIGVAGIPAASLVAIVLILKTIGLPMEGVGLILAVDRILDMCRTSVNVFSDSCGAVIIAKLEGEEPLSKP